MTFSLILRDPETGEFGSAISSSSPAVAARCVNLADGVGGAHSQNVTDPRLGPALIEQLRTGRSAQDAVDAVVAAADPATIDFRQLLVLDAQGAPAVFSGGKALGVFGAASRENAVAGGNMLASLDVLDALVETALTAPGRIEERLLAALRAAVEAGGEAGPVHSAGIAVVGNAGWRVTDLRVDWADDPVEQLGRALDEWLPQRDDYVSRGLNPTAAPSYGVPGDE
ncbi:fimbrial assembly protein FimA [Leucobacter sp. OLJS4]|uniref:DUF1028 domain-containing protein n=1 Tax=unclassified Leucobacter TaxID=2621730 RepID=UPI000C177945|nr:MULTISPECIES: DUF1028 domain-containing protein [unclassified Leucobacter]PII83733.1 fimbrial assembly protein FimA [Leucobacter sp. OLCALW19]PII90738.1 fimbrial assembly protein FimA [Leucobacter sp. OLAS13]PII94928.1 fimbrial assembly protein FimA [Leucobacter sp. OLTLW20]PII96630.1 fimbrial assembly protein FimA [Leucobacter sp. OLDS2]PII97780.1 fimbrial assembly protein FimA [Leucobacter sp. OLCS4]